MDFYPRRQLTEEEWANLTAFVSKGEVFALMVSECYGFGIKILSHPVHTSLQPETLLVVSRGYLPPSLYKPEAEIAAEIATTITHTKENLDILRFYRMAGEQKEPGYHCY